MMICIIIEDFCDEVNLKDYLHTYQVNLQYFTIKILKFVQTMCKI